MSVLFATGLKNRHQKFAASKSTVYQANEDGLIQVTDPDHIREFQAIYRIYDPASPFNLGDEVTVQRVKRAAEREEGLVRLEVPSDAPIVAPAAAASAPVPPAPPQSTVIPPPATPSPAPEAASKPWIARAASAVASAVTGGSSTEATPEAPAVPATEVAAPVTPTMPAATAST